MPGREYYTDCRLIGTVSGNGTIDVSGRKCRGFLVEAGGLISTKARDENNQEVYSVVMINDGDFFIVPLSGSLVDNFQVLIGSGTHSFYELF